MNTADINPLTLPSLPLLERSDLPNCPAVYFVLNGDHMQQKEPPPLLAAAKAGVRGVKDE